MTRRELLTAAAGLALLPLQIHAQETTITAQPFSIAVPVERDLNALPQFTTEIDGATIHFIHA